MANNLSDYVENKLLDHIVGKTSFTMPTTYLALFTVAPTDSTGGTEVTGGSYARVATAGKWAAASGGQNATSADISFPEATASWGTVVAVAIMDASTLGNILWYGTLTTSKTVDIGDTLTFVAGDLTTALN